VLAEPGTIGVGYNTIRFDDEVTRHMFWRNLIDPYAREWQNDCGRWDLLDVVRMAYALRPEGIVWPRKPDVPVERIPHPSTRDEARLLSEWHDAVGGLRQNVAPDSDGDATGPNYGSSFKESDYAAIPRGDLPFGVPDFLGDDSGGRQGHPRHNNCVSRPTPDDGRTLIWVAPRDQAP
jgi:hypothetical protein